MVVAILGNPFAGKHALAATLAPLISTKVVTFAELRDTIARSITERGTVARTLIAEGRLLTDALVGELLSEAVADDEVIIVGRPRNLGELDAFCRTSGCTPSVVHLEAGSALIDARMAARGMGPVEVQLTALQRASERKRGNGPAVFTLLNNAARRGVR
jgi:adenylate kinase family enzyme